MTRVSKTGFNYEKTYFFSYIVNRKQAKFYKKTAAHRIKLTLCCGSKTRNGLTKRSINICLRVDTTKVKYKINASDRWRTG